MEERDVEIEQLGAGKGKKSNKSLFEQYQQYNANHKFHISKLEGIMRLVNNNLLSAELVDDIKEEMDYYMDAYDDEEYIQAYDDEMFYENLALEELDVVNVDTVKQPLLANKGGGSSTSHFRKAQRFSETAGNAGIPDARTRIWYTTYTTRQAGVLVYLVVYHLCANTLVKRPNILYYYILYYVVYNNIYRL